MNCTIGLLGGGQLGQMLCEAANSLGLKIVILDNGLSPAKQINAKVSHIDGSYSDPGKIRELAEKVDILTVETEHVDTYVLEEIAEQGVMKSFNDEKTSIVKVKVQPSWRTLRIIQDKYLQKQHLINHGIQTVLARPIASNAIDLEIFGQEFGFPYMLKTRKNAYDGRGNFVVKSSSLIEKALDTLKGMDLYAEKWVDFVMELSVMVVKVEEDIDSQGSATLAYPTVETIHQDSICKLVYAPARGISDNISQAAQDLARAAVGCLWGRGVFGVELFLLKDGKSSHFAKSIVPASFEDSDKTLTQNPGDTGSLLVNEIAPRPHNSGHYTIEACPTFSQYKSQLLSILGMMPKFEDRIIPMMAPASIMLNILGGVASTSHEALIEKSLAIPSAALHVYGKESKPGRKIGHITIISSSTDQAEQTIMPLVKLADYMRSDRIPVM